MTDAPHIEDDGLDLTAAEHALGVLDLTERAAAETRMAADPPFAREVQWWQAMLSPLVDTVEPVQPSAAVWPAVRAAVAPSALGRSLTFWRGATAASAALAAACLMIVVWPKAPEAPPAAVDNRPALVSVVASEDRTQTVVVARLDRAHNTLILTPVAMDIPATNSAELWIIPAGGAPKSLGLMPNQELRMDLTGHPEMAKAETATIAITLEPAGGSPTGDPTGPIVASGTFART